MTNHARPKPRDTAALDEETVADWLHTHPDFFIRHAELLETLQLQHNEPGTISLIERQVAVLREKSRALERRLTDLVQVARENEGLARQIHRLAIGLLEADGLDTTLAVVNEILRDEFRTGHVAVLLVGHDGVEGLHFTSPDAAVFTAFADLLSGRLPRCGRLARTEIDLIFPEGGERISSAAVVPLLDGARHLGLLALGSEEAERFQPEMGTLFLGQIGETISAAIARQTG